MTLNNNVSSADVNSWKFRPDTTSNFPLGIQSRAGQVQSEDAQYNTNKVEALLPKNSDKIIHALHAQPQYSIGTTVILLRQLLR
jgi:hypothetical protein